MPASPVFKMPNHYTIPSVVPSLSKAFAMAILPMVTPSEAEIDEALDVLGMTGHAVCSYCGDKQTQWDHFRPVVVDSKPTGYISEIQNLVPSCGPCNSSKGNQPWRTWITGPAKNSPATRGVRDLDRRIARLVAFENWAGTDRHRLQHRSRPGTVAAVLARLAGHRRRAQGRPTPGKELPRPTQQRVTPDYQPGGGGMKYVVTSPSGTTPPLPKNRAVLTLVRELAVRVPLERIRQIVGPARFRSVPGELTGDALWARFAQTHGLTPAKRAHWFVDEPIHLAGQTWLLQSNVWGPKTETIAEALDDPGGGTVSMAPL